jgi:hypothetical protein
VRRRWRIEAVLRAIGQALAVAAAALLAAAGVAALIALSDRLLAFLVFFALLVGIGAVVLGARRLGRPPGDRQVARFIEEKAARQPDVAPFDDVLVSAVGEETDEAAPAPARDVRELVVFAAWQRLEPLGPASIVTPSAMRRAAGIAFAGAAALVFAIVGAAPILGRAAETAWIAAFPSFIDVQVLPGDARVPKGQPMTIRASVRAGLKPLTRFTPQLTVEAGPPGRREARTVQMSPDGSGFLFTFDSVDRSFDYRVSAGSRTSRDYSVTALVGARVARIELRYEYPAFANLPPREEKNGGDIYAPAGTKVRVRVHTDKPIASGNMLFAPARDGGQAAAGSALRPVGDQVLEGDLVLARDDSYRVRLTDRDGLSSSSDTEYFLRVMDDRPPDVRILRPAADQQVTPLEEVAIEARAEDDYGITRFDFVYAVAGRPPQVVPFERVAGTDLARAGTLTLAVEDLRVQPGDVITYYARARDVARGKKPTETRSDIFFLEVRPFSEEFVLAQSQAMAGMASEQIETLIAAQKEIINATWNIERRASSGAGRSQSDITAIAAAQAELKTRAEQIAPAAGRGRGAIRFPQQLILPQGQRGGRPAADPVGAAISAMSRAIGELEVQKTSAALPHEMAALQGLVQAQAEVRRREVAQQAGASMGGMGRQGQDLSALFDKELQRQQRTNYETRSQAETRPDRPDTDSALDKIRDLAQRQEELARKQRELANTAQSPEETKRQLEKLMREQEALRQQAEDLARQAGQQPGAPQGGSSPQQGGGSGDIREAADEMRGAAGELQRQSPGTAAERAERAASGLRQLEQQMRRDSPEAQRQAAGNARLEAQQIADEQRRIAGQASRLEKETSGDGANQDAWRRLSGEKDKLADRVDALQRSVQQLTAGGTPAAGSGHAANLGKELTQEQIARRMRETAKKMREAPNAAAGGRGAKSPAQQGAAEAEQQIARALDQMVDRMAGGEAQTLSRELDQSRSIRERLNRLESQMREAGGSEDSQRLREQYARELGKARESLARLERGSGGAGVGGTSPEEHEWSGVDKGTEAFKQDFSKWESLRKDVDSALDRYEASIISRAARKGLEDRLSAGGSDRAPDDYRRLIARYYESLAKKK